MNDFTEMFIEVKNDQVWEKLPTNWKFNLARLTWDTWREFIFIFVQIH